MSPSHRPPALLLLLACALLLLPLSAAAGRQPLPRTWPERIQETDELLRQGSYAAARKKAQQVVDEMAAILLAGEKSDRALAMALTYLALAQAGSDQQREAEWSWYLAQSLDPDLGRRDLSPFGEAGRRLEEVQEVAAEVVPEALAVRKKDGQEGGGTGDGSEGPAAGEAGDEVREGEPVVETELPAGKNCDELTPPVKRKAPHPQYPSALRAAGIEGPVVLLFILDAEGRLTRPVLAKAPTPGMGYLVAETTRRWTFEPALCDGEPADAYYNLNVNMMLGR